MTEQLHARVAWLYYLENFTQAEIGEHLGLTRARVNRMLAEARETGLVRVTLNSQFANCTAIEQKLKSKFGVRDAVIVPTPEDVKDIASIIGMAAGTYLTRFLAENRLSTIGIGWGATLRETIRHVSPASYPDLWITSMMGGLSRGLELNTFEIAGELAQASWRAMQLSCRANLCGNTAITRHDSCARGLQGRTCARREDRARDFEHGRFELRAPCWSATVCQAMFRLTSCVAREQLVMCSGSSSMRKDARSITRSTSARSHCLSRVFPRRNSSCWSRAG